MNANNNTPSLGGGKGEAKNILQNKYIRSGLYIIAGLLLGWLLFHSPAPEPTLTNHDDHEHASEEKTIWTCSMHPQIRMDEPGQCPICGMDLIPLQNDGIQVDEQAIGMSEAAMKLAEVQTSVVTRGETSKDVLLYGKIAANERLVQSQTAHIPGRIEQLLVNVTGEQVRKGQLLAQVYSPELVTAQKELTEALALKDKYPGLVEASREKLRNWKLSDKQISEIENSGNIISTFPIYSNTSGVVISRKVNEGDYVSRGAVLLDVTDLSKVWAVFDAYETDLPWIQKGQQTEFTTQSVPGKNFTGKVSFIDPVIDPATRIARVRVELDNPGLILKPEMFINGTIHANLKNEDNRLLIPQSAVLWTGQRSVVYVKLPNAEKPSFKMREITLGPSLKNSYVVLDGLAEGEEIVTNGTFSVDAAAQLAGKPSMMNQPEKTEAKASEGFSSTKTESITSSETLSTTSNSEHAMFKVSGNCDMCKDRIETAAKDVGGVLSASWDADKQMMHLNFDPKKTSTDEVQKAIAAVGHDTEKYKAPDSVYNELPECCLYRDESHK